MVATRKFEPCPSEVLILKVLLCVSSGIALYKAVDLTSRMRHLGWQVKVVMTENASKLVSPVVFSAVGNCEVFTDTYEIDRGWIVHTELSSWADVLLVAPATANTIAKIAHGFADNLLTTTVLAFDKQPKVLVPTMNTRMFENAITQSNIERLKALGWFVVEPDVGALACGEVGKGRYPDNDKILEAIRIVTTDKKLVGKRVLVTAGPTREAIDPVRFISNYSSGKMGYALAKVSKRLGAEVCLISGPTHLGKPHFVDEFVTVESAREMFDAVFERKDSYDILIMCAAVADYTPKARSEAKIKKMSDSMTIELQKTLDILATLGASKRPEQVLVGFAAETEDLLENAREKLLRKGADFIVANFAPEAMGSDTNHVFLISREGLVAEFVGEKEEVAKELIVRICEIS